MDYKELLRVVKEENISGMLELINRSGMSYLDIIDEFEEDPEIISSRKKKEQEARQEYRDVAPIRAKKKDTEDEDIEFLDLN